jgi:hypothetical protein
MRSRLRRAAVLATTLLVVVLCARPSDAQVTDPTVAIDRTGTAAGEEILITGGGWPGGATLIVELCGHGGLRGTVDCDVTRQRSAGVGPGGTFSVELTTGLPPSPCPCVVKATDLDTQIAATAPIAVAGLPTVPFTEADMPAARTLEISSIELTGGGRWAELFGAGGRRVLEVTLVNTGAVAVDSPDVSVAWGTGSHPDGFVKPPETTRMEPGDTQTLTVALDRAPLTLGEQTAIVEIQGLGEPVVARATTSGYPWGLLVVGLVLLQLLLLRIRNRVRRRMRRRLEPLGRAPVPAQVVLELPAAPAALSLAATDEDADDDEPVVVLDLVELELAEVRHEVDAVRHEVVELLHQARVALTRAMDLSEALAAIDAQRQSLIDLAQEDLARLVGELEERAAALPGAADVGGDQSDLRAASQRQGDLLDRRLARALERALAPVTADNPAVS